jgi:hypothetical protein
MIHQRLNYLITSHEIDFQYIEKEVNFLTSRVEELRFCFPAFNPQNVHECLIRNKNLPRKN